MTSMPVWEQFIEADPEARKELFKSRDIYGFWQGLLRVVGSFGDCPRCLAVCPVGNDYHAFLADHQKVIPEKTPEKVAKAKAFKQARKDGMEIDGLNEWNRRWVGPDGYQGIVARQFRSSRPHSANARPPMKTALKRRGQSNGRSVPGPGHS